jgi:hypothetical protein
MVSTPVGEAKVNSVNVMSKTVRLWLTEQKQVIDMPLVDLQMQYGVTVRPVELVQEIEAPLQGTETTPGAAARAQDAAGTAERPSQDDGQRRRRRGRRGGRQRRRDGGGPPPSPPGP